MTIGKANFTFLILALFSIFFVKQLDISKILLIKVIAINKNYNNLKITDNRKGRQIIKDKARLDMISNFC